MGRWHSAMATSWKIVALVEPCSTLSLEHGEPQEVTVVAGAESGWIHIRQASTGFVRHRASRGERALLKLWYRQL
ncbi:hypothetical protein BDA96_07G143300 [Sorghum bicolor]|uniref:SH3 domain-containing protein n=1 Tax=Sorghum bicolor TaxID=4558 RepID=A0A921QN01_SORBI|nr:hypothetical protein BDA96_07G143300 [Sorghum bicolor]